MKFDEICTYLLKGKKVYRTDWNNSSKYIYLDDEGLFLVTVPGMVQNKWSTHLDYIDLVSTEWQVYKEE